LQKCLPIVGELLEHTTYCSGIKVSHQKYGLGFVLLLLKLKKDFDSCQTCSYPSQDEINPSAVILNELYVSLGDKYHLLVITCHLSALESRVKRLDFDD